jgi:hypothetical protein
MSADQNRRRTLASLAAMAGLIGAGVATADEEATPDLEFLEYLGSWEASDEDWVIFTAAMEEPETSQDKDNVQGSDPSPDGEKLAEMDDET